MSLRADLIEALATVTCSADNLTAPEVAEAVPCKVHRDIADVALDAMLDLLTERADEWADLSRDNEGFGDVLRRAVAVLRNPGSAE